MYQGDTFLLFSVELIEAETFSLGFCLFSQCCAAGDKSYIRSVAKAEGNETSPGDACVQCIAAANSANVCDLPSAHSYTSLEAETGHTVEFYHRARVDDLWKRFENAAEMTEHFVGRDDFLHTRHIDFGQRDQNVEKAGTTADANPRPIVVCMAKAGREKYVSLGQLNYAEHPAWGFSSFSVGMAEGELQMRHPSIVQLLCLTVAFLTELPCDQLSGTALSS